MEGEHSVARAERSTRPFKRVYRVREGAAAGGGGAREAQWTCERLADGTLEAREHIVPRTDRCIDNGTMSIRLSPDGKLDGGGPAPETRRRRSSPVYPGAAR
jgi:hypothetical protein